MLKLNHFFVLPRKTIGVTTRFFATHHVNSTNFQQLVEEASFKKPIIVDCKAEWCGPCKILGPKLERVVDASQGQVDLAIVDVDESQEVAEKLSVSSIPAVFAFHKGKIVGSFIGNQDQAQLEKFVNNLKMQK